MSGEQSTPPPTSPEASLPTGPVYCLECQHSAPEQCKGCGGRAGFGSLPPCQRCRPRVVETSVEILPTSPQTIIDGPQLLGG